jgi:hypothetical protein
VDAHWEGCGRSGGDRDQFTFKIEGGVCFPILVQRYTSRCTKTTQSPSPAPTPAPTAPTISVNKRRLESAIELDIDRLENMYLP